MAEIQIYHNPSCSKSRQCVALFQQQGHPIETIHYLDRPPQRVELEELLAKLGLPPSAVIRRGEAIYQELGLAGQSEGVLLQAMLDHPILIERPIVVVGQRAMIGRPPEKVLDWLSQYGQGVL